MDFKFSENLVKIINADNFDLSQTFDCGQCFRWNKIENKFTGTAFGKTIILTQNEDEIIIENTNKADFEKIWKDYFDVNTDYSRMIESLSGINPVLDMAIRYCSGIRILRQDPWEALCSFIISQNNNIPRIKKIINSLCVEFGENIGNFYSFPEPKILANLSVHDLDCIRAGFRAKYVIDAAKKVCDGTINFDELKTMPADEASKILMQINGVGPKVADCVLLYGLHNFGAFPMDVWMKKIMAEVFPGQSPEIFGCYRGLAQQYLYHFFREHKSVLY